MTVKEYKGRAYAQGHGHGSVRSPADDLVRPRPARIATVWSARRVHESCQALVTTRPAVGAVDARELGRRFEHHSVRLERGIPAHEISLFHAARTVGRL